MAILAYATGVSQLVQGESSVSGSTSQLGDYVQESFIPYYLDSGTDNVLYFEEVTGSFGLSFSVFLPNIVFSAHNFFTISDGSTNLMRIRSITSGAFQIYWYDGTSEVEIFDSADFPDLDTTSDKIRFDIYYDKGSSGSIEISLNRDVYATYSGDTSASGINPSQVSFVGGVETSGNFFIMSGFFIADEDTKYITPYQLVLSGNGTHHSDFSGDYSYLNNLGSTGDTSSVTANEPGDSQTYTVDGSPISGLAGGTVVGVGVHTRGKVQEALQEDLLNLMISDGTYDAYSDNITMDEVIRPYQSLFSTAPDGSSWDVTTIGNYEFGFKVGESE